MIPRVTHTHTARQSTWSGERFFEKTPLPRPGLVEHRCLHKMNTRRGPPRTAIRGWSIPGRSRVDRALQRGLVDTGHGARAIRFTHPSDSFSMEVISPPAWWRAEVLFLHVLTRFTSQSSKRTCHVTCIKKIQTLGVPRVRPRREIDGEKGGLPKSNNYTPKRVRSSRLGKAKPSRRSPRSPHRLRRWH